MNLNKKISDNSSLPVPDQTEFLTSSSHRRHNNHFHILRNHNRY